MRDSVDMRAVELITGPRAPSAGEGLATRPGACAPDLASGRGGRRGSVLVLVMTILGILFVVGIAFLASMNFEAEMILTSSRQESSEKGVRTIHEALGSMLRDGLMSAPGVPFGDASAALTSTAFAEMPGVQNSFSAIEPYWEDHGDADPTNDQLVYPWIAEPESLRRRPFFGPSLPHEFQVDTRWPPGVNVTQLPNGLVVGLCVGGAKDGTVCAVNAQCPGGRCIGETVVDADGDGISDSRQVKAAELGLSRTQLQDLAAQLNPPSNPSGQVYAGLRIIAHGGLVNLNASHPTLIQNVLSVDDLRYPRVPQYGYFQHRPTQALLGKNPPFTYSPLLEEAMLRRRNMLAPREVPPSLLHGDRLLDPEPFPSGNADMHWQLFPPTAESWRTGNYDFYTVFDIESKGLYEPLDPAKPFDPGDPDGPRLWAVRMEPDTSQGMDPMGREYDRRHLVTTVSVDDTLSRGGRVLTPSSGPGGEDIVAKMIEANQTAYDPEACAVLLPFEYADYPPGIPNKTRPNAAADTCDCPTKNVCRFDPRKGRMQLSLPWIDDELDRARQEPDLQLRAEWRDRVFHVIHDTFMMLVRNALYGVSLEFTPCTPGVDEDCPPYREPITGEQLVCRDDGFCALPGLPPVSPLYRTPPGGASGCETHADCVFTGSGCELDGPNRGRCVLRAPYWQDASGTAAAPCSAAGEVRRQVGADNLCVDAWTLQAHSANQLSRTAAALTANLIDFADGPECVGGAKADWPCATDADCPGASCGKDLPTRVAVRSFDFEDPTTAGRPVPNARVCTGGAKPGQACVSDNDCGGGTCPLAFVCDVGTTPSGGCLVDADCGTGGRCPSMQYVYGLERQPYISEVLTVAMGSPPNTQLKGWAVELFNPYFDVDLQNVGDFWLYVVDPSASDPFGSAVKIHLNQPMPSADLTNGPFAVYYTDQGSGVFNALQTGSPMTASVYAVSGTSALTFLSGWVIYLVRQVVYPPGGLVTEIIVDQFKVGATSTSNIGKQGPDLTPAAGTTPPFIFSEQRAVTSAQPWTVTVPQTDEVPVATIPPPALGDWNTITPTIHPVEVNFADTGFFRTAFPTTGSLLLTMRHANRSVFDALPPPLGATSTKVLDLASTTRLAEKTSVKVADPLIAGSTKTVEIEESAQIDNGRLPVFDRGFVDADPMSGSTEVLAAGHHLLPALTPLDMPGDLWTLPWGQLVFDYFTALPLSNPGPYAGDDPKKVADPWSQPRVDLDGLRVHGRININAAPWKVLEGLPLMPTDRFAVAFRGKLETVVGTPAGFECDGGTKDGESCTSNTDCPGPAPGGVCRGQAATIGELSGSALAKAIVAYRELRAVGDSGNYDTGMAAPGNTSLPPAYGRGWNLPDPLTGTPDPAARRGMGFLSVGELANVRHYGAGGPEYRVDAGLVTPAPDGGDYIQAIALLVTLGDWVTVRSQVFTVYGVLRGEEDSEIAKDVTDPVEQQTRRTQDVDSRAIRFQETIDRLPTFLGEPSPRRIGERTVTKYTDSRND